MGRPTLKQPEQALKIAQAVQAWQRNAISKRCPIQKLAEKIGVSVAVVRRVMVNTRKTVRKAEDRCRLRKKIASESKKEKTPGKCKHQTTPKLVESLNLTSVSSRTARRDRHAALQERKRHRAALKHVRKVEHSQEQDRLDEVIRQNNPITYAKIVRARKG